MRALTALLIVGGLVLACGPTAQAGSGDIAIFTEAGGADVITTSVFDHDWDTTVRTSAPYTLDSNGGVVLGEGGHYLVMYNSRFDDQNGGNSGSQRVEIQSQLNLAGGDLPVGWSQGYIRGDSGQFETVTAGGGIIDANASDVLTLRSFRTDSTTAANRTIEREPGAAGIQLIKLDDGWDYLRLSRGTNQTGPTNETFIDVTYDSQDELDAGSFGHVGGSGDITLKTAGHYLVLANTYFRNTGTSRTNLVQRLTLDGALVDGSFTNVYERGSQSTQDGAASIGMIIETTAADQILNVEAAKDDGTNTTNILAGRTAVTIVKLPDEGDYIRLTDGSSQDLNPAATTALTWDTQVELDADGFSRAGSEITAEETDDYLFLTAFGDQAGGETGRAYPWQRWRDGSGTLYDYGQGGMFHRNSGGSHWAGGWSGLLIGLDDGNSVEVVTEAIGAGGGVTAEHMGLQGVRIGSLFVVALVWDGIDPGAWVSNHWGGVTPVGGEIHVVGSGKVEVRSDPTAAKKLTINGGEVEIQTGRTLGVTAQTVVDGGTLDVIGQLDTPALDVVPGGTLAVSGTVNADSLTFAGTSSIAATADIDVAASMTVDTGAFDLGGGSLTVQPGGTLLVQNGGSLDQNAGTLTVADVTVTVGNDTTPGDTATLIIDGPLTVPSLVLRNGGSLTHQNNNVTVTESLTLAGSDLNMTGAVLNTAGAAITVGSTLTVDNQTLEANSLDLQGTLTRTGAKRNVTITDSLTLAGDSLDMTGHTLDISTAAVTVNSGRSLTVDNAPLAARAIDLSDGGTLDTSGNADLVLAGGPLGGGLVLPDVNYAIEPNGTFTAAWDNAAQNATALTLNAGMVTVTLAAEMYYSFDNAADPFNDDSAGGAHDGVPQVTAPTWLAGGQVGGAVAFDGNENGLRPTSWAFMEDAFSEVSMAMWLRQDANTAGNQMVLDEGGTTNGLGIALNEGVLEAAVRTAGQTVTLSDSNALTPGWHHVAVVYGRTNGLFELYLDGNAIDANTHGSTVIAAHGDDPGIGYLNGGNPIGSGRYFGEMDELYYYERALKSDEIIGLRDDTLSQPDPASLPVRLSGDAGIMTSHSWPLQLGDLTVLGNHTLTLDGPGVSFSKTTLSGATAVTVQADAPTDLSRDAAIDFGGADATITKTGPADLLLSRTPFHFGAGTSKLVAAEGHIALTEPGLLDPLAVELDGGGLRLSAPADAPTQTYSKPITMTGDGAITAGKATPDANDDGAITYSPAVSIPSGKALYLGSTGNYTLSMGGALTGGIVRVNQGTVSLDGGATLEELKAGGAGDLTLNSDVDVTNLTVTNDSIHAGAHRVNVAPGGVMRLDQSTFTATAGSFQATGEITRSGAETIVLGGPGSVLTVASPKAATFQEISLKNDTNNDFPDGGSLATKRLSTPTYTLTASGNDIWGGSDGMYYAYQEFDAGDPIDISARVGINGYTGGNNAWRKAGVMIRATLDQNSRNGFTLIAANNGNGINAQIRKTDGVSTIGATATGPRTYHAKPAFLRLTYAGDGSTFDMYYKSYEEDPWFHIGTNVLDVPMTGTIYAGLGLTSHNTGQQTTIDFDMIDGFTLDPEEIVTEVLGITGEGRVDGEILALGTIAPGTNLGTIQTDSITFGGGSSFAAEFDAAGCDLLEIAGDLTIADVGTTIEIVELGPPSGEYTLATWTGTLTGAFENELGLPAGYLLEYRDLGGAGGALVLTPEPATLSLLAIGACLVLARRSRKRRR